jgi:hypothetical protein
MRDAGKGTGHQTLGENDAIAAVFHDHKEPIAIIDLRLPNFGPQNWGFRSKCTREGKQTVWRRRQSQANYSPVTNSEKYREIREEAVNLTGLASKPCAPV